jgi:hypothetical protein
VCGEERRLWALAFYGEDDSDIFWSRQVDFWADIASRCRDDLTVWINRRSAPELTSFMEFLWRLPENVTFGLGDCTDKVAIMPAETGKPYVLTSTGTLNPVQWAELLSSVASADKAMFQVDLQNWARLKQENAPLRAFAGGHLMSVPADHHDGDILASIWPSWRRTQRVVSECLAVMPANAEHTQVSDLWILRRMELMADTGVIEFRDGAGMPAFEVRLRERQGTAGRSAPSGP